MRHSWIVIGALIFGCTQQEPPAPRAIKVAAASDLALAFNDVAAAYQKEYGVEVKLTLGSSGLMSKQITQGAPFDLFASANQAFVDDVIQAGACSEDSKAIYAQGRIAVWSAGEPPKSIAELADPRFAKIAIANPEHAPYGAAAKDALIKAGVWDRVEPKLVYGENIQQTMQFAQSGNVEAAIVALSLAIVSERARYSVIDAADHRPLIQMLVACGSSEGGRSFAQFVGSDRGRDIMRRYGFFLPGEAAAVR